MNATLAPPGEQSATGLAQSAAAAAEVAQSAAEVAQSVAHLEENWCITGYHMFLRFALTLFFLVSVCGNSVVCYIYGRQVTRTSYAFFVLTLAITDLTFTLVFLPWILAMRLMTHFKALHVFMYELLYNTPNYLFHLFTLQLLTLTALERLKIFSEPLRDIATWKSALVKLTGVFFIDIIICGTPFLLLSCCDTIYIRIVTQLIQPMVIIACAIYVFVLNVRVARLASTAAATRRELTRDVTKARERNRRRNQSPAEDQSAGGSGGGGGGGKKLEEDDKMIIALVFTSVISCAFALIRIKSILNFVLGNGTQVHLLDHCIARVMVTDFIPYAFSYLNYAHSPFMYYVISTRFRHDVSLMLRRVARKPPRGSGRATSSRSSLRTQSTHAVSNYATSKA